MLLSNKYLIFNTVKEGEDLVITKEEVSARGVYVVFQGPCQLSGKKEGGVCQDVL